MTKRDMAKTKCSKADPSTCRYHGKRIRDSKDAAIQAQDFEAYKTSVKIDNQLTPAQEEIIEKYGFYNYPIVRQWFSTDYITVRVLDSSPYDPEHLLADGDSVELVFDIYDDGKIDWMFPSGVNGSWATQGSEPHLLFDEDKKVFVQNPNYEPEPPYGDSEFIY